jgi:hypothetical protein
MSSEFVLEYAVDFETSSFYGLRNGIDGKGYLVANNDGM